MMCKYHVKNLTEEILSVYVSIGIEIGPNEQPSFLVAGETVTKIEIMPSNEVYTFTYTFVPLKLGMLDLPNFTISKLRPNPRTNAPLSLLEDK